MTDTAAKQKSDMLARLPSVDELMNSAALSHIRGVLGPQKLARLARQAVETVRGELLDGKPSADSENISSQMLFTKAEAELHRLFQADQMMRQRRVINATGVIIHTNLGRAPLSDAARHAVALSAGYASVEYDLETGRRGYRGGRAELLLCELTGAESAIIVNNCASAAFLVLSVLAAGREVIVSRGELVEIGGDFRVPDVLARSGAVLREVGTTNRTKLKDYEQAINENTAVILRVHPSNYKIIGFTASASDAELASLAREKGVIFYEDAGSGALVDLSSYGLRDEPVINRSIADGADIVTFSGDKLLGGPQAGLVVGRKEPIEKIRRHSLFRALRANKLTYAGLEATLEAYLRGTHFEEIPVLRMLAASADDIRERSGNLISKFNEIVQGSNVTLSVVDGRSVIGGGSAPGVQPDSILISVECALWSADDIAFRMRKMPTPVIGRIYEDRFLLDLRTVFEQEESELLAALRSLVEQKA